jgi:peptidoglycan/xylan/chitin deacetylase (PgdA/CDA1 family)
MQVTQKVNVPILTYHSLDNSGSVISTAPEIFRRQMQYLSENGYKVVTLKELINSLSEHHTPFLKTVALTFDDGFQNFLTEAFPVLEEYNFKATVFLVTDFCGKNNDWAGNPPDFPSSKLLSWQEIKELHDYGIEFGNHTRTHPDLTKISESRAESEINESKNAIENALGSEVTTFAYPFGKFNPAVKQIVENKFKAACSTNLGKVQTGSDFYSLERLDTYYLTNPRIFNHLSSNAFDKYMFFRQTMREFKALISRN